MSEQTVLTLLRNTEHYLSALHGSVARHDNLAADLACAGCELRDKISAALQTPPEPVSSGEDKLVMIDGRDALAYVIIRPGSSEGTVELEANAKGLPKSRAATVLRHIADRWAPRDGVAGILDQVAAAYDRHRRTHGRRDLPDGTGQHPEIIDADTTRMALDGAAEGGYLDWLHILRATSAAVFAETNQARLRNQLLRLAADAVVWVEAIDRRPSGSLSELLAVVAEQLPADDLGRATAGLTAMRQPSATVAYRRRDGRELRCLAHVPAANLVGVDWFPLTDAHVEGDASRCTEPGCGTDVLADEVTP